jgi:hypothetical protein
MDYHEWEGNVTTTIQRERQWKTRCVLLFSYLLLPIVNCDLCFKNCKAWMKEIILVLFHSQQLFACFDDIKKAYDCTYRQLLFYKLMTEYNVGGSFLKLLQSLYANHEVYVRLSDGLLQPIMTTRVVELHHFYWSEWSVCATLRRCSGPKCQLYFWLFFFFFLLLFSSPSHTFLQEGVIVGFRNSAWGFNSQRK